MEYSKKELDTLIANYLSAEATEQERQLLEHAYFSASAKMQLEDIADTDTEHINAIGKKSWENLMTRITAKKASLWPRIAVAASLLLIVSVGLYFYRYKTATDNQTQIAYQNDVAPGKVGATLTLASGKKIRLTDAANGEIAKEAGISVTKTADGQLIYKIKETTGSSDKINTLSTAQGETYILILPDKSKVWLNAASSLTYSANLIQNGKRRVKLTGEAYFEVAKDKKHPFIVKSRNQSVEVLGTHFNINAYDDETIIKSTLLEGSVSVVSNGKSALLKPGQQSVLAGNALTVQKANIADAVAWKNGEFRFSNEHIESIMRKISRWYDVEIDYKGEITNEGFNGAITRFSNIEDVLKIMERSKAVHFKIQGRRIIVEK